MSKRIRLTDRRRQAVDGSVPYPGTVNQPERQFKEHGQYDNWVEVVNHPLPDMRHEWKREQTPEGRNEIGFGIPEPYGIQPFGITEPYGTQPTIASINIAANKSVRAAILLLGEKVAEDLIEEQARDFMLMGGEALDRTLARFTATENIYRVAEDDDDEGDEGDEGDDDEGDEGEVKEASTELAVSDDDNPTPAEQTGSQEGKHKGASQQFDADVQAKIAELKAEVEAQAANREAYNKRVMEAAKKALAGDSEDGNEDEEGEEKEASQAVLAGNINIPERVAGPNEMDIELQGTMDSEIRPDTEADAMLAGLFDDGTPAELPEPGQGREASAKQGINSLGGQPKVASANGGAPADISSIWDSAPDVSEIFN